MALTCLAYNVMLLAQFHFTHSYVSLMHEQHTLIQAHTCLSCHFRNQCMIVPSYDDNCMMIMIRQLCDFIKRCVIVGSYNDNNGFISINIQLSSSQLPSSPYSYHHCSYNGGNAVTLLTIQLSSSQLQWWQCSYPPHHTVIIITVIMWQYSYPPHHTVIITVTMVAMQLPSSPYSYHHHSYNGGSAVTLFTIQLLSSQL